MESSRLRTALTGARACERLGWLQPSDWPDFAVALLLRDAADAEIAELAGLRPILSGWETDPLVIALYERYAVPQPTAEEAVTSIASLAAADLRSRPAAVTAPMVRLIAQLAPPGFESDLANQCFGAEEYLDCDCHATVEQSWIHDLDAIPGPDLPDPIVKILARRLRATLPATTPRRGH